jgi:hypothetical protein
MASRNDHVDGRAPDLEAVGAPRDRLSDIRGSLEPGDLHLQMELGGAGTQLSGVDRDATGIDRLAGLG